MTNFKTNFKTKFKASIKSNLVIFALLSTCLLSPMLLSPARAAGEIKATDTAARTLYAVIENPAGQVWNGSSFAAYADANWTTYAVSVPEQGTSQQYVGNMPAGITTAARYSVIIYERQGAGAAVTDPVVGQGILDWTGTVLASEGINTNTLTGINAQTAKIGTNALDSPNEITAQGLVTAVKADTGGLTASVAALPTAPAILALIKADSQFSTLLNRQKQRFVYVPSTRSYQPLLDDGTTSFGSPLILSVDALGNILQR